MSADVCPYLRILDISGPDYSSSDASARVLLCVSYACALSPLPRSSRRVCPRGDGRYESCPVRLAERVTRERRGGPQDDHRWANLAADITGGPRP